MMCLQRVYKSKKKKEVLAKLPNMITCWKVVQRKGNQHGSRFVPEYNYNSSAFLVGWNKTEPLVKYGINYKIAFHAFLTKDGAESWMRKYDLLYIIKCKTKKEDIVAIGEQNRGHLCIVTKRIWIPKPKKKTA